MVTCLFVATDQAKSKTQRVSAVRRLAHDESSLKRRLALVSGHD